MSQISDDNIIFTKEEVIEKLRNFDDIIYKNLNLTKDMLEEVKKTNQAFKAHLDYSNNELAYQHDEINKLRDRITLLEKKDIEIETHSKNWFSLIKWFICCVSGVILARMLPEILGLIR